MGLIHTPTYKLEAGTAMVNGFPCLLDLSSEITRSNNRMCKQMSNFKIQGITIQVDPDEGGSGILGQDGTYVTVKGRLRYLKPTRGRIAALKKGRAAWFNARKSDGLTWNKHQDFRITPQSITAYTNMLNGVDNQTFPSIPNISTLNGSTGLACFANSGSGFELFTNHNDGLLSYSQSTANLFDEGLTTRLDTVAGDTDFTRNEEILITDTANHASDDYEYIPFSCSYSDAGQITNWSWTPSPNQYLSVLCGWFEILLDEIDTDADSDLNSEILDLEIQFIVSGWSSISKRKKSRRYGVSAGKKRKMKRFAKKAYNTWKRYS